jgi:hypothetical protein
MKFDIDCRDMARLISERQDRRLPLVQRAQMQLHFMACRACRNVDHQVGVLRRIVRDWGQGPGP